MSEPATRFLVILFGTLEFDGRVQRMIEVLRSIGQVSIVDVAPPGSSAAPATGGIDRHSIQPDGVGKVRRHFQLAALADRVARTIRPDVVVAEDYYTAMPGRLVAARASAKFVYDAHELIIPESGVRMGVRDRVWYHLERLAIPAAALVIAANPERARLMQEHYGLPDRPEYVRNIPPLPTADAEQEGIAERYPAMVRTEPTERVVLYQGNLSWARGVHRFVEAFEHLPSQRRLVVVGGGPAHQRLDSLVRERGLGDRVSLLGRVPNRHLGLMAPMADLGIVTYPFEGLNNIFCAPNKLFEYAQAGLPVVSTDQPPLRHLVTEYDIGELVTQQDSPRDIAERIETALDRVTELRTRLGPFLADHRWESEAARFASALDPVIAAAPG